VSEVNSYGCPSVRAVSGSALSWLVAGSRVIPRQALCNHNNPGQQFDPATAQRLGSGHFATVYLAREISNLGVLLAVKVHAFRHVDAVSDYVTEVLDNATHFDKCCAAKLV